MKKVFTYLLLALTLYACTQPAAENKTAKAPGVIDKALWMLGDWENVSAEGTQTESWKRTGDDDTIFTGNSYFIRNTDTMFAETIKLEQRGKDLYYIVTVKDQNKGQSIAFKLTAATDKQLVFENPTHDFPQKVTYHHPTADSLNAEISGIDNGKPHAEQFLMVRKKQRM